MTSRERLLSVFRGEKKPDRVPWSPLIDGYFMNSFKNPRDILDVFREIEADVMERHIFTWTGSIINRHREDTSNSSILEGDIESYETNGITVTNRREPDPRGTKLTVVYDISGYTLTAEYLYTDISPFIPYHTKRFIENVEDLEAYTVAVQKEQYLPKYSFFENEDKRVGDAGIATDTGLTSPIQSLIQVIIGVEKFYTEFYIDHLDKVEKLMDAMHEKNLECYKIIAESPAEVVINYENTSTTLVSPAIYEKYSLPLINEYADLLHKKDKIYLTHRCGKLKNLVDLLKEGREDGIVDISPEPTGDLSLWEARKLLPEKIVLGGIDPTFLTQWSVDQVKGYVRQILDNSDCSERLIIGTADATPQDARIENLKAVGEVIRGEKARE